MGGVDSFHQVRTIPKATRRALEERAGLPSLALAARLDSEDGTRKYVWELPDGGFIESVLIPDEDHPGGRRLTLCVSSQVGCAMACSFCLTGDLGLKRHLSPSEIANQVRQVQADLGAERRITNIVMMGMGEPLHNLENLIVAIANMRHEHGLGLSHRKITVSTVGLVPAMQALMARSPVNLAVSLNATTEEQRLQLMPITRRWSLAALMEACRGLPLARGRRITFEYVMLRGFNDSMEDAARLAALMQGVRCKINLIPYNENPERELLRPSDLVVWRFQDHLVQQGLHTSVRRTRGRDISAACGQLGGAEQLARRVTGGDPSQRWRAEQRERARRGEARRIDDGQGDLLAGPAAGQGPGPVAESAPSEP
jgi:23S rRNA (adenine2503-C2)-methyltransferase